MDRSSSAGDSRPIYTIGHSTRPWSAFVSLLEDRRIECLVDVRSYPGSRRYPQYNRENLETEIPKAGIGYCHLKELGGRRKGTTDFEPSPNTYWEHPAFRNYADYALTEPFQAGLAQLEDMAHHQTCAIMCSEAVWWRCHRRIITDYLLRDNIPVLHIMGEAKIMPASMTPAARPTEHGWLIYDGKSATRGN